MMKYDVVDYHYASKLNPTLYDIVCKNLLSGERGKDHLGGRSTSFDLHKRNIKEIDILITWIKNTLPQVTKIFAGKRKGGVYGYLPSRFKIVDCWGTTYNKGESLREHNHFPFILSFVYGVRMPKGASPFIIGNNKVRIGEGLCVFFLSSEYHHVNFNNCEGRCVISGNLTYYPEDD